VARDHRRPLTARRRRPAGLWPSVICRCFSAVRPRRRRRRVAAPSAPAPFAASSSRSPAGVSPVSVQMWEGVSPVPAQMWVQMWHGGAQSRCGGGYVTLVGAAAGPFACARAWAGVPCECASVPGVGADVRTSTSAHERRRSWQGRMRGATSTRVYVVSRHLSTPHPATHLQTPESSRGKAPDGRLKVAWSLPHVSGQAGCWCMLHAARRRGGAARLERPRHRTVAETRLRY
jgi:hypothetical protein